MSKKILKEDKCNKSTASKEVVTEVGQHDVLMGRGASATDNAGNVRYRIIVQSRRSEYVQTRRRHDKDRIAREIIAAVHRRGGRFLRKVEAQSSNDGPKKDSWVSEEGDQIIAKVKQTIRDLGTAEKESQRKERQKKAANFTPGVQSSPFLGNRTVSPSNPPQSDNFSIDSKMSPVPIPQSTCIFGTGMGIHQLPKSTSSSLPLRTVLNANFGPTLPTLYGKGETSASQRLKQQSDLANRFLTDLAMTDQLSVDARLRNNNQISLQGALCGNRFHSREAERLVGLLLGSGSINPSPAMPIGQCNLDEQMPSAQDLLELCSWPVRLPGNNQLPS